MKHVILGAGPAGVIAAETIRKHAPDDSIVIVGDEPEAPYSRMAIPYLLMGNIKEEGTHLRHAADHYARLRIDVRRGRAKRVDTSAKQVLLDDGSAVPYDRLLIATGSSPATPPIPGIDAPGVHSCWTLADARAIMALARPGAQVLQMGAGFIGCIILEALAARGVELAVVEMGDRMVPRMMGPTAGGMIKDWCESKGVAVYTGARVDAIEPHRGAAAPAPQAHEPGLLGKIAQAIGLGHADAPAPPAAAGRAPITVRLSTGRSLPADLVINATGVKPNIGCLEGSGVRCLVGVLTDEHMQTSVPGVYAAGDCAEAFDKFSGKTVVSAIQPNAADQGRVAGLNMAGHKAELNAVTQINVLDTLGLISASFGDWQGVPGGQHVELTDRETGRHLSLQFGGDRLVGCNSIGWTEHVGVMRGLVEGQVSLGPWKERLLADPTRLMEAYLARAQAQEPRGLVKA
ncbi:MAG: NAD(P)/FAD-dependent oxidoreductase [Burkholderiales bacterium]|nr:MAG: NAD(P)/FAD-dependent oxidoreductase [Burkholderiales bacterium]